MAIIKLSSFKTLDQLYKHLPTERACIEHFIKWRWPNGVTCPHCCNKEGHTPERVHTYEDGISFKCNDCRTNFSYTVGTIFQNTKKSLRLWYAVIFSFCTDKLGKSSSLLKKDFGITLKTAWHMKQRIRFALSRTNERFIFDSFSIVQGDEAVKRGNNANKHAENKDVNAQGRAIQISSDILFALIDMVTRKAKIFHIDTADTETIINLIKKYVAVGATIYTDEYTAYKTLSEFFNHEFVKHKEKQYCNGDITTNLVEGLWALLKKLLKARYTHVASKYTQMYLDEFNHRYNLTDMETETVFNDTLALSMDGYATLWEIQNGMAIAA